MKLTPEKLKRLFVYDPEKGVLVSKVNRGRCRIGDVCGNASTTDQGYYKIRVNGKIYKTHRLIYCLVFGYFPNEDIHHIDNNKLNNKIENLQEISKSQHSKKHYKLNPYKSTKKEGHVGVTWHKIKKKWESRIKLNRESIYLGAFSNFQNAVAARQKKEKEILMGAYDKSRGRV